ncbi:MAG: protein-export rane protein SecF [Dehalococcoidia bacterium]|nr:protein-export rane protein SecF [Dehalococcoidia bacterium]
MLNLVGKRYWFFLVSAIIVIPGLISLFIPPGLQVGIEFTSGSSLTFHFEKPVEQADLREAMTGLGHDEAIIQRTGGGDRDEKTKLEDGLKSRFGEMTTLDFYSVSPLVAAEVVKAAIIAVIASSIGMLIYIAIAFRKMPSPWRYGATAIITLIHDVLVVVGIFSIMGKFFNTQIDALFITAILTVVGYSVNDTVVIFDRIRENMSRGVSKVYEVVVNRSLVETLARSLNTGLGTMLTIAAMYLFGGVTIQTFMLALLIGITSGTYSGFFTAATIMVVWENKEWKTWFRKRETKPA